MSLNKRLMSSQPAPFVASENFKVVTYTGNSGTQAITGVGFKPDLVWFKSRTSGNSQNWTDSTRGAGKLIFTNNNDAEYDASAKFTSFDADGFTLSGSDNYLNNSSQEYVAWCFKAGGGTTSTNSNGSINSTVQANSDAGFSIIKYDGGNISGSTTTVGHGLSAAPELIIVKTYESGLSASEWFVYSQNVGNTKEGYFNQNGAFGLDTDRWNSTSPTSSVFTLGSSWSDYPGYYGGDTIAYAFHSVTGFSKIGSYTGTGTTGNAQVCGFEPAFLLSKRTSSTSDWYIIDNKRNTTNPRDNFINANTTDAEYTPSYGVNFNSNGFSFISTDLNGNGQEWIYMAFAADPDTEAPTLASSFNIETWTGNDNNNRAITGLGFNPNLVWIKRRNSSESHALYDSLTGANNQLSTDTDAAIAVNSGDYLGLSSFDSDGFTLGNNGGTNRDPNTYVGWTWKADDNEPTINEEGNSDSIVSANSNAGFSIVKYTGNQTAGHTIGHGLSAKPDMIILKCLDTVRPWYVYHKGVDASNPAHYNLRLNETDARQDSTTEFNDTEPTSTVFTLGTASGPNGTNSAYIAYCFHDVAGYQKFGSYAGSGSAVTVTTGFKPDFVMIKSTSVEWWNILDSKRDFNKRIYPSENNAESGASDYMTVTATSFTITVTGNDSLNNSGKNFIYWAIAKNVPSNTTLADSFGVVKYTGIGASKKVQGLSFKPDLVWMKQRSGTQDQMWYDNNRGAGNYISSNNANAQGYANSTVTSFDSDGFSVGSSNSENQNSQTFVAWCWKAGNTWQSNIEGSIPSITNTNTANGFSVVKWTGTGSNGTVGHGLSSTPELIISKNLDTAATDGWPVYSSAIGNDHTLFLNSSSAKSSTGGTWGSTSPTSSVFTVQDNAANNQSSNEIIAYCFHSVSGYSKISSYSGTGSSNAITGLGFRPDTIILKEIDGGDSWQLYDTVRGPGKVVYPNGNNAEYAGSELTSFDSDGFTVSGNSSNNESGKTYLYAAWKMNTTLNTTLENSFRNMPYTGTGAELAVTGAGFKPDLVWITSRDGTTWNNVFDSVRGTNAYLATNSNSAVENTANTMDSFDSDGFTIDSSNGFGNNNVKFAAWAWKAGNGYVSNFEGTIPSIVNANTANGFSIIRWEGTGAQGTIGHGLNSTPEIIISKRIDSTNNWNVYHKDLGLSHTSYPNWLYLNLTSAEQNSGSNANHSYYQAPSSALLYQHTGSSESTNVDGGDYISYCWHSVAGYSKIDEYTGTGTGANQLINTGFQPDWVMFKDYSAGGSWFIVDSSRGGAKSMKANDPATEGTTNFVTFESNGFRVTGDANATSDWVYMAFKMN